MNNNGQSNKKKTTGILLSILSIISLVLITAGVTYAFFTYSREGETDNQLKTGTITFYYDETYGEGTEVNITEAIPMTDEAGKALSSTTETFDFQIVSTVTSDMKIPYEITVRKDENSSIADSDVKIYLEKTSITPSASGNDKNYTTSDGDTTGTVKTYEELKPTSVTLPTSVTSVTSEKTIWWGEVPAKSTGYSAKFRLRMWIKGEEGDSNNADYSPYEFVKLEHSAEEDALDAEALIKSGDMITSTEYYKKDAGERATYERIAAVDQANKKVFTASQKVTLTASGSWSDKTSGFTTDDSEGTQQGVQYYRLNNRTFKVNVNVYSGAATVVSAPAA